MALHRAATCSVGRVVLIRTSPTYQEAQLVFYPPIGFNHWSDLTNEVLVQHSTYRMHLVGHFMNRDFIDQDF